MNTTTATAITLDRSAPATAVRALQAGDADAMRAFVCGLGAASKRLRFHGAINGCSDRLLAHLMAADGHRHVAFVATRALDDGEQLVGEARYFVGRDGRAEFAIAVADSQQGHGVAQRLMAALIAQAREAGLSALDGEVLDGNGRMQGFVTRLGFSVGFAPDADPGVQRWTLGLQHRPAAQTEMAPLRSSEAVGAGLHPLQALRGWWRAAFAGARA